MNVIHIERLGGFAGFGGPGAHLRSRGQLDLTELSSADRAAVQALFDQPAPNAPPVTDGFRYQLRRQSANGPQTIEIDENRVPLALKNAVKDELV